MASVRVNHDLRRPRRSKKWCCKKSGYGSPETFAITCPSSTKFVLLYSQSVPGAKASGLPAIVEMMRSGEDGVGSIMLKFGTSVNPTMPDVCVSRLRRVTCDACGARGRYLERLSSTFSLPCCCSSMMAAAVNCLVTEPMANEV